MKVITGEWLKSADDDLNTIKAIIDDESLTHIVAFHSQQCILRLYEHDIRYLPEFINLPI